MVVTRRELALWTVAGVCLGLAPLRSQAINRTTITSPTGLRPTVEPGEPLQYSVGKLAAATNTPLGFESRRVENDPVAAQRLLDLRNVEITQVLPLLLGDDGRYTWQASGTYVVIRPAAQSNGAKSFLEKPIGPVEMRDVVLSTAHDRVLQTLDSRIPPMANPKPIGDLPITRPFSVTFAGGTIADLLAAIVQAHKAAFWTVTYAGEPELMPFLTFGTFDGNYVGRGIPRAAISVFSERPGASR